MAKTLTSRMVNARGAYVDDMGAIRWACTACDVAGAAVWAPPHSWACESCAASGMTFRLVVDSPSPACLDCGRNSVGLMALGRCATCYSQGRAAGWLEHQTAPRVRPCSWCGREREILAQELCSPCYSKGRVGPGKKALKPRE